jgi:hypothetical protein
MFGYQVLGSAKHYVTLRILGIVANFLSHFQDGGYLSSGYLRLFMQYIPKYPAYVETVSFILILTTRRTMP